MTTKETGAINDKRREQTLPQRTRASRATAAIEAVLNALILGLTVVVTALAFGLIVALLAQPELVLSPHGMALLGEQGFWIRLALGALLAVMVLHHCLNAIKAMRRAPRP